jgi:hypothetical protein
MPLSSFSAAATISPEGRLVLADPDAFKGQCRAMRRGPVTVDVVIARPRHSQKARGYYRGVVLRLICDHTGDDPSYLHDFFKKRFQTPVVRTVLGEPYEIYTTAEDDSQEFYDFVEAVRRFALVELAIETPDPDPRWKEKVARERAAKVAAMADAALAGKA